MTAASAPGSAQLTEPPHWFHATRRVRLLTPRELELFLLLVHGESNHQLAARLVVSERTIRAHLASIARKLDIDSRLALSLCSFAYQGRSWVGWRHSSPEPLPAL